MKIFVPRVMNLIKAFQRNPQVKNCEKQKDQKEK